MIYALDETHQRVRAERGVSAVCPGCRESLIPKCGRIKIHHWAHQSGDCDPWWEPETRWHLGWKEKVDPNSTEVVIGCHRADIVGNAGGVIELQHSTISPEEIEARESFYGRMVWVIDGSVFDRNVGDGDWPLDTSDLVRWRHPRKTLTLMKKKQFWDMGKWGMYRVREFFFKNEWTEDEGWGSSWVTRCYADLEHWSRWEFERVFLSEVLRR